MKSFPVGLSDEQRAEWQAAADVLGVKLAQWIRDSCEMRLRAGNKSNVLMDGVVRVERPLADPASFKGPDWKPEKKKKEEKR